MKEVTEIKVGQKYKQRGYNAFGIVMQADKGGYVFILDCLTDKMFAFKHQDFIDGFELVAEKPKEDFQKNFALNLLLSLFILLAFLAVFALCQYIGFNAFVMIIVMAVTSAVSAVWELFKS